MKYKILWESLKETADHFATIEGFNDVRWSVLSKMMKDGEEMLESGGVVQRDGSIYGC